MIVATRHTFALKRVLKARNLKKKYRIHSNKRPGHLTKSFRLGAYLFHYYLQWSTKNPPWNHIQAHPANEYG